MRLLLFVLLLPHILWANPGGGPPVDVAFVLGQLNTGDRRKDIYHIQQARNYPYSETEEAVLIRLQYETIDKVKRGVLGSIDSSIIFECLSTLSQMASVRAVSGIEDAQESFAQYFSHHRDFEKLNSKFDAAIGRIQMADRESLPEYLSSVEQSVLNDSETLLAQPTLDPNDDSFKATQERFALAIGQTEQLKKYLESQVFGQPEILEALAKQYFKDQIFGRQSPKRLRIMGLPDAEQEESIKAYVRAINPRNPRAEESDLYRMMVVKNHADVWTELGSTTGHVGSNSLGPFVRFAVEHSGGRYEIKQRRSGSDIVEYLEENPAWRPGHNIPGHKTPEQGVVLLSMFDKYGKGPKDTLLRQAISGEGRIQIQSPQGGLSEIFVPLMYAAITDEGASLLANREANGQRRGKPLPYETLLSRWEKYAKEPERLRQEVLAQNGGLNHKSTSSEEDGSRGESEEFLSKFNDSEMLLARPSSPEVLKKVTEKKLAEFAGRLRGARSTLGDVELTWNPELRDFLASYKHVDEKNTGPILGKVQEFVEEPLMSLIRDGVIKPSDGGLKVALSLATRGEGGFDLQVQLSSGGQSQTHRVPLKGTIQDTSHGQLTDEEIEAIGAQGQTLRDSIFNVDHVIDRLVESAMISAQSRKRRVKPEENNEAATFLLFTGLSSTGKSALAEAFGRTFDRQISDSSTIAFGGIKTVGDLQEKISGYRLQGEPVKSDFIKLYDDNDGHFTAIFDELEKTTPQVIYGLYDLARKPNLDTAIDGRPRPMNGVTIIGTANVGEEIYAGISNDLTDDEQMAAMQMIYHEFYQDEAEQRSSLDKYFPPAFTNRIGLPNIYFFGPLTFKALRQLTQHKVVLMLRNLSPQRDRRGWNLVFEDKKNYEKFLDSVERAGFVVKEQGASIDRFVSQILQDRINATLLKEKVPQGAKVVIRSSGALNPQKTEKKHHRVKITLTPEGGKPIELEIQGKRIQKPVPKTDADRMLVAYHEAGHSLVRQALLGDRYEPHRISLRPGVTSLNGKLTYFAGINEDSLRVSTEQTRAVVIAQIAVLMAGAEAQRLVTKGGLDHAGKSSDYTRASQLARHAILAYGISEGIPTAPADQSQDKYLESLSPTQQEKIEQEVKSLLDTGRDWARQVLLANYNRAFLPLGALIAEKVELKAKALKAFYKDHAVIRPSDPEFKNLSEANWEIIKALVDSPKKGQKDDISGTYHSELLPEVPLLKIQSIEGMVDRERRREMREVQISPHIPFLDGPEICHRVLELAKGP